MPKKSTILVVDDDKHVRETIKFLLSAEGYNLAFAASGQEALEKAAELIPDLMLLDVLMPGIDGFEVCRRLRADPHLAELPIVMVTALNDRSSRLRGIKVGADDIISKPVDYVELKARIHAITRVNRYRRLVELKKQVNKQEAMMLHYQHKALIGVMASGLHDEIMQPMHNILSTVENCQEVIRGESIDSQKISTGLNEIATTVQQMEKIIHHIHQLSSEPKPKTETEPVDINCAIEDALIGFQQQLKSRGITITKNLADDLPPIQANKVQIEQVFINLVINAREALDKRDDKQIRIATHRQNGNVQIRVEDNGDGIAPEEVEHIFDSFFTGKKSMGFGLYIVQDIVKTYNGTIDVESTVNDGTTFVITFPLVEE
jgi:signal transduction histidine kinase